jgi:hypothetical protein
MRGRRALIAARLLCACAAGACSSGRSGNPSPGAGGFNWTEGGKTTTAIDATFTVGALFDGSTFLFTIRAIGSTGMTCTLLGQFATAVPPPAGTYPMVQLLDGTTVVPQPDASFTAECQPSTIPDGGSVLDPSVSGQVVLTTSAPGGVEGTFMMEAAQFPISGSATTSFSGTFKAGCLVPGDSSQCGPLSLDTAATCADLSACCEASVDAGATCMVAYASIAPHGDAACGRALAANKASYCP